MLHPFRAAIASLPQLMKVGLVVTALGAVIDAAHHLVTSAPAVGHGSVAFTAHLVTLVGMIVTMVGLFGAALKRRPTEAPLTTKGKVR